MDRRTFLIGVTVAVAGCVGSSGAPETTPSPTPSRTESTNTATATQTTTKPQTPTETTADEPTENPYRQPTPIGTPAPNGLALVGVHPTEQQRPFISGEYITLENTSNTPLDLSGYTLRYHRGKHDRKLYTFSLTLEPGARVYVLTRTGQATKLATSPPGYLRFAGYEKPVLNDSGGVITVTDSNGDGVLKQAYDGVTPDDTTSENTAETPISDLVKSGPGNYPHAIVVTNKLDSTKTITVTVKRVDANTVLYQETHEVGTGENTVAGFTKKEAADPDVHVIFELPDGQRETIEFLINSCYGYVFAVIDESGDLQTTYSIC